jgi:hypothetical protein
VHPHVLCCVCVVLLGYQNNAMAPRYGGGGGEGEGEFPHGPLVH